MQHRCSNCIFWICRCQICEEGKISKKIQLCINCFMNNIQRKKFVKIIDEEVSKLTKIESYKQLISNERLLKIYALLDANNVEIRELSKKTIEEVHFMELFFGVNRGENPIPVNYSDDIPGNQQANFFYTDSSFLFNLQQ
ncbi:unnamed protein product [Brachionus calyciflorus]|uniref:Uncharacterized protein n=1 Tax=Brachionus calyciflorus TaxID=104777 RepID=A0A814NBV5_9BILA|nr:unnamed protein product [Brachionus calyciflorus]